MKHKFDFPSFCESNQIEYVDEAAKHEHSKRGWINVHCPFCHSDEFHLGWNVEKDYFNCWRCGFHRVIEVVEELILCDKRKALQTISEFSKGVERRRSQHKEQVQRKTTLKFPVGTGPLKRAHQDYLRERKFNPIEIERLWSIQGTSYFGPYKFRIMIPIFLRGRMVSYQGRDYTGKAKSKYKACRSQDEVVPHKDLVYGADSVGSAGVVVVCEGVTDVWRLGTGAVCTFGIDFTLAQVKFIQERWKRVVLFFDEESFAQAKADELAGLLDALNVNVTLVSPDHGDPGSMTKREVFLFRKETFHV